MNTYVITYVIDHVPTGQIVEDPQEVFLPNSLTIDEHLDEITHQIGPDGDVDWDSHYKDRVEFTVHNESWNVLQSMMEYMKEYILENPVHLFYDYRISFTGVFHKSDYDDDEVKDPGYQ